MLDLETEPSDYMKYRGRCKEMSEELISRRPELILVRGYYLCPSWGKQPHWWCVDKDGTVIDPTKDQFPSKGFGEYVEFDGFFDCSNCGKRVSEEECNPYGNYVFCSGECLVRYCL